jgi:hypothetical protein
VYVDEIESIISQGTLYNPVIIDIYFDLISHYKKSGDGKKVALYQAKYIALQNSTFSYELMSSLMKIEGGHIEKENQEKIETQNKMLTLKEDAIARQQYLNIFIGLVILLLVILVSILHRNNRQKHLANQLLDKKVQERTQELQQNRDALERSWLERDAIINKASIDLKSSIATMKGLCLLGAKEIDHPKAPHYLQKMDDTSDRLSEILNNIFHKYTNGTREF